MVRSSKGECRHANATGMPRVWTRRAPVRHLCILASAAEGQALAYYYSLRSHGAAVHLQQVDDNVRRREGHLGMHDGLRVL
jgi:hypothetical protein